MQVMDEIPKIFQLSGGWGNVSGPGLFMIRMFTSGFLASVFVGMTGASTAAIVWDTAALPFLISAIAGFAMGAAGFYHDAMRKSLRAMDRYPRLMQLHLDANFSHIGFDTWTLRQMHSSSYPRSWQMRSMLATAWMTASPAIESIKQRKEEELVSAYAEEYEAEE